MTHETYTFLSADGYKWSCSCSEGVFHGAFTRRRDADDDAQRHLEGARASESEGEAADAR